MTRAKKRKARVFRLVMIRHKDLGDCHFAIQEKLGPAYYRHIDRVNDSPGYMYELEVREVLPKPKVRKKR